MNHDRFIRQVQHRAGLSFIEAELVSNVVLETLAEWLLGESPDTLTEWVLKTEPANSTQLPKGIASYLKYARSPIGKPFPIDEFFLQVSQRGKIDVSDAIYQSGVVIEVLQEATAREEIEDIYSQLPKSSLTLFEAGSEGRMETNR